MGRASDLLYYTKEVIMDLWRLSGPHSRPKVGIKVPDLLGIELRPPSWNAGILSITPSTNLLKTLNIFKKENISRDWHLKK